MDHLHSHTHTITVTERGPCGQAVNPWIRPFHEWRTAEGWSLSPLSACISTWLTAVCQNTRALSGKLWIKVCHLDCHQTGTAELHAAFNRNRCWRQKKIKLCEGLTDDKGNLGGARGSTTMLTKHKKGLSSVGTETVLASYSSVCMETIIYRDCSLVSSSVNIFMVIHLLQILSLI